MGNFDLIFQNGSGSASTGTFDQDAFLDFTTPPTNNTGLTSNASTNPLGDFFNDDDIPRYSAKVLWIKDYTLISDRNLWVNNKPTYRLVFNEQFTPVHGYAFGDIDSNFGCVRRVGDGFGVTGNVRRVMWIVKPSTSATATAQLALDGANTTTIDFSNANFVSQNALAWIKAESSNETAGLHDFRVTAIQANTLQVVGLVVYTENAGANIQCDPGSTYNNKIKQTNSAGATLALPAYGSSLGGKTVIYKSAGNVYAQSAISASTVVTIAQGSSGINTLSLTPGDGAKFNSGDVLVIPALTPYVGNIRSISTDTLTMGVTLTTGFSGSAYRAWSAGTTYSIGATIYSISTLIDASISEITGGTGAVTNYGENGDYALWGSNFTLDSVDGYRAIRFLGASYGQINVDGYFSAASIEWVGAGIAHATFLVNGLNAFGINAGQTGPQRQTVFINAGPGWNSFQINVGASHGTSLGISKINLYQRISDPGVSYGQLATLDTLSAQVSPYTSLVNGTGLGIQRRHFADYLYFNGGASLWYRGATTGAAGGIQYGSTTAAAVMTHSFYGKGYAVIGSAGTSYLFAVDGVSTGLTFNSPASVSEGWHTIQFTHQSGTCVISAVDVYRTNNDVVNVQNAYPLSQSLIIKTIEFDVNGPYSTRGTSQTGVLYDVVPKDIKVLGQQLLIKTAGSTGVSQVDVQVSGLAGFTSMFLTLPSADSSRGSAFVTSSGVLAKVPYVVTKNSVLRFDIQNAQTAGNGMLLKLYYQELS